MSEFLVLDVETALLDITSTRIAEYMRERNITFNNPVFSRVVSVGFKEEGRDAEVILERDERILLQNVWARIKEFFNREGARIVTWNGYRFDIPFLITRSLIVGVRPTVEINTNPWTMMESNHLDLLQFLSCNEKLGWNSLPVTCAQLGIEVPDNYLAADVITNFFRAGELEKIREHNHQDLELTEALYLRFRAVLPRPGKEPATEKQKRFLESLGVPFDEGITKREASRLIDEARQREGLE
jgi:predicted PolB exonuclease-like 3'-5' exonuclease